MRNTMSNSESMTNRRHRFRRIAKFTGTILSASMFTAWLLTVPLFTGRLRTFSYRGNLCEILISCGEMAYFAEIGGTFPRHGFSQFCTYSSSLDDAWSHYGCRTPDWIGTRWA